MKKINYLLTGVALSLAISVNATNPVSGKINKDVSLLREVPVTQVQTDEEPEEEFKPSISVGSIVHMYASSQQKGFYFGGNPAADDASDWRSNFTVYRGRILVGGKLSPKGSFFMETELMSSVSGANSGAGKNVRITPMILDCQYEHVFMPEFSVIAGLQLVSHNRNGLQGAAGLMANDFTYFQYPYNLHPNSPLQGNLGRDLGLNFRGIVLSEKLEYRLGVFSGRTSFAGEDTSPLRFVGRAVYNVFDADKSFYYSGTNLGKGKTLSIGGGFDSQGTYLAAGADVFLDVPAGPGSVTLNGAFSYITGGNDIDAKYTFAGMIPTQNTQYLELGYYLSDSKIQPWIRYEKQAFMSEDMQTGGMETADFDKYMSVGVLGGGVNYWFNGYGTNLRLSYTTASSTIVNTDGNDDDTTFGQLWAQLQFFIF